MEKVNRWPMIVLISWSAFGLLAFSMLQFKEKRDEEMTAVNALQAAHTATEAVMRKIGRDAARNEGERPLTQKQLEAATELRRLEAEDRAALKQ